ncbi:MAG: proteasome subunit beta [Nanoarchaeota archaeon]|nr:proteasome subunit beta [Nanoarchaeota archaeon]
MIKMEDTEKVLKTGTTTLGLICKDGIILAADRRATAGYLIANKKTQKIIPITDKIAVTIAGTASDAQLLARYVESELKLKMIRTKREVTVKEAANLTARFTYNNIRRPSMIPGIAHFIVGGADVTGFYIYDVFPDGSIAEVEDFISSGSGSVMVYGVLETLFKKGMMVDDAKKLAIRCINAAIQRDIASGNGIDIIAIRDKGIEKIFDHTIESKAEVE